MSEPAKNYYVLSKKRPKNVNISGTIYSIYSPKIIDIKPTGSIQIDTRITVPILAETHATVIILPTVLNHTPKRKNNSEFTKCTGHLILYLRNQTFSKKFASNKNNFFWFVGST